MAAGARQGGLLELTLHMAVQTARLLMLAFQGKSGHTMIKARHAVHTIVAGEAVHTKILLMNLHKIRIVPTVAIHAGLIGYLEILIIMTSPTGQRRGIVVNLVPNQAEVGGLMVKKRE
jgi:hypothetical protein